ncbi:MAG TPA: nicotinate (nicotinamide) nucleotide adenylyltransferase [Firmicutes bacterium]|nr:nicotinate (nicotinamide) nucleotide adenylyltransferase [Bacillota bacterium]
MIVVFGGSFNPPTIAHYKIADYIINTLHCDQFYYLPVGDQYPKKGLQSASDRVAMLKMVANRLNSCEICLIEVEADKVLTTYESLSILQNQYPNQEIAFVFGADNLKDLPKWSQSDDLIDHFKLIVFRRDHIDVDEIISSMYKKKQSSFIILDQFEEMDVSSTMYRNDETKTHLVLTEVDDYIKKHHLYGRGE